MRFLALTACLFIANAEEMGVVRTLSEAKFGPTPGLPPCISAAVESGDPSKGPSVIVFKGTAGCSIQWHWHTPTEHVMIVSGTAKVEMKHGATAILGPGGYAKMPAGTNHYVRAKAETIVQIIGTGPFQVKYVNPGDDPRTKTSKPQQH